MTRSSLLTGRSWEDDLVNPQESLKPGQVSFVVSQFLCQSNDRRGDEVDYHGFVSKIDLGRPIKHLRCRYVLRRAWELQQRSALLAEWSPETCTSNRFSRYHHDRDTHQMDLDLSDEIVRPWLHCQGLLEITMTDSAQVVAEEEAHETHRNQVSFSNPDGLGDV